MNISSHQSSTSPLLYFIVRKFVTSKDEVDTTSHHLYAMCSISYLGAMLASNKALQWVSYPTQVRET